MTKYACDGCQEFYRYGIFGKFCPACGEELKKVIE